MKRPRVLRWPAPYRFAFGITDDTDGSCPKRTATIYDFCLERGIRPSLCAWMTNPRRGCGARNPREPDSGATLENEKFRELCLRLHRSGVEIGLHGVSSGNNPRAEFEAGLDKFRELFGADPRLLTFHSHNAENAYWGRSRFKSPVARALVTLLVPGTGEDYSGHDRESVYYISDMLRERVAYIRLYRTLKLDVLRVNPSMPYHLSRAPDVRHWFSANAEDRFAFRRINRKSLDRLADRDGLLLLYAHLSKHAVGEDGAVHPVAARSLDLIGSRDDCWRAPASEILDRCLAIKNVTVTADRNAITISNPTAHSVCDLQVRSDSKSLFRSTGESLRCIRPGVFVLPLLAANASIALYPTAALAQIGDPKGIGRFERLRMVGEEFKRLVYLRQYVRVVRGRNPSGDRIRARSSR